MAKQSHDAPKQKNLRALHQIDAWPKGHVIHPSELHKDANVRRLLALGAVEETDDQPTGALNNPDLPPGAAVSHQLVPGDELPPNTLEDQRTPPQQPAHRQVENLNDLTVEQLRDRAREGEVEGFSTMRKDELVAALEKAKK